MDIDDDAGVQMASAIPAGDSPSLVIPEQLFVALQFALAGANPNIDSNNIEFVMLAVDKDDDGSFGPVAVATTLDKADFDTVLGIVGNEPVEES